MARERYLRGVSEEELRPDPKPPLEPQTPRSWLENFWYHHKAGVIVAAVGLIALVFVIAQIITRERPDYRIVLTTETPLMPELVTYFENYLAPYGTDVNGDGEVIVQLAALNLGGTVYTQQDANAQALQAHLITGDVLLYLYEPQYGERLTAVGRDGAHCFLEPLSLTVSGGSEDGLCWNWKDDARHKEDLLLKEFPEELCFGVRSPKSDDEKSAAQFDQCVALVEAFAQDKPTAK